jgi:hypothetical protein
VQRRVWGGAAGQAITEFALVAPIFLFLIFSVVNGGIFLYARADIQHAADLGAAEIAAEGNTPATADQIAIHLMDQAGLSNTILTQVTKVTLQREDQVKSGGQVVLQPDATELDVYLPACQPLAYSSCVVTQPWPPADRNVGQGGGLQASPDYARLTIYYTFTAIGGVATFSGSASVVFRLQPQTL